MSGDPRVEAAARALAAGGPPRPMGDYYVMARAALAAADAVDDERVKFLPEAKVAGGETELAWVDDVAFVNAAKHEARVEELRQVALAEWAAGQAFMRERDEARALLARVVVAAERDGAGVSMERVLREIKALEGGGDE